MAGVSTAVKTTPTTTAVAKRQDVIDLPFNTTAELVLAGDNLAKAVAMFGLKNNAEGFVVACFCKQRRMDYFDFLRTYHLIEGKPSMKADAMAAEFRKRGGRYTIIERSAKRAAAEFDFEGAKTTFEFDYSTAESHELTKGKNGIKDNWRKHPENMLWARMMSNAIRVLCPEINAGIYTPEEMQDVDDTPRQQQREEKVVTPVAVSVPEVLEVVDVTEESIPQDVNVLPPPADERNPFMVAEELEAQAQTVDYTISPVGTVKGKPWAECDDATLEKALTVSDKKLPVGYKNEINKILEARKADQQ